MMHDTKRTRTRAALPVAAIAALLLAGCSTGHIGESWQCPLAEGGLCDSVAAADPAVPERRAAETTMLAEPLWRVRAAEADTLAEAPCPADCDNGFDPFAWLARLFQVEAHEGEARPAAGPARASSAPAMQPSDAGSGEEAAARTPEPEAAPLPAEADPSRDEPGPAPDGPDAGDLRTGEVMARIWIAPFVDANGVYREAAWVRAVLAPAGWRLP